ncbi:hypothetical protein C8J57DRAFT_231481 [Mycena rebaudengoi]|nr:hypothetical protein C8J57DRAFT_231481 [Mycena rebaudengoi]
MVLPLGQLCSVLASTGTAYTTPTTPVIVDHPSSHCRPLCTLSPLDGLTMLPRTPLHCWSLPRSLCATRCGSLPIYGFVSGIS